jgi:CHAD domain-containing protein
MKAPKEETVHDLRVATRRLLALLDLGACLGARPPKRLVRRLERVLESLSPVRDAEVQRDTAKTLAAVDPRAEPLKPLFRKRHERASARALTQLARIRPRSIASKAQGVVDSLTALADPGVTAAAVTALAGEVARAHVRYQRRRLAVTADDERTLHRMRVAFKHYRYAFEALMEVSPDFADASPKAMKALGTRAGPRSSREEPREHRASVPARRGDGSV